VPGSLWSGPVPPLSIADGTANATASAADLSPGGATGGAGKTIYPGMLQPGTIMRLCARGEYTTGTTANPLSLGFYWGGTAGTAIAANTALASVASLTAAPWWMAYEGEFRALGTSGSLKGSGMVWLPGASPGLATAMNGPFPIPVTAAARTVALSTVAATVVTVSGGFTAITGGSTVTCYSLSVELLG
jgi:hypothetical protein